MLLRDALGETLRDARTSQNRTLRDVSTAANVSLGYLSEVERGRKEASSELLASICDALDLDLSDVLTTVSDAIRTDRAARPLLARRVPVAPHRDAAKVVANADRRLAEPVTLVKNRPSTDQVAAVRPAAPSGGRQLRIVVPYSAPEAPVR